MAFANFTDMDELLRKYGLTERREVFVQPVTGAAFSAATRELVTSVLADYPFERSEVAAREALIFPLLYDVSRHYRDHLTMLSGEPLEADDDLRGELDYMVCRRSPRGPLAPGQPVLLVGEAKRDDKSVGWGQALGGMLAAQKLGGSGMTYYGLATTGSVWRFGRLSGTDFVRDPFPRASSDLDGLAGALHFVFSACRDQVLSQPPVAS